MKKVLLILIVLMPQVLFGCNKGTQAIATPTPTASKIIQNTNDSSAPIQRLELTDPALYNFLSQGGTFSSTSNTSSNLSSTSKKLNKLSQISTDKTNGISGSMQIVNSENIYIIKIADFNYNGKCGQITFGLGVNRLPKQPIYKFSPISSVQTNVQFDLQIPSNIDLIQFDTINIYCSNQESPVSITQF